MTTGAETAQAEIDRIDVLIAESTSAEFIAELEERKAFLTKIVNRAADE